MKSYPKLCGRVHEILYIIYIIYSYNVQFFGVLMRSNSSFLEYSRVSSIRKRHDSPQKKESQQVYFFPTKNLPMSENCSWMNKRYWGALLISLFPKPPKKWAFFQRAPWRRQWGSSYRDSDSEDGNDGDELSEVGWDGFSWNSGNQIGIWALGKFIMTSVAGWSPQILLKK